MERNGSVRLAYWIMGVLMAVVLSLGGLAAKELHDRISAVELTQNSRADTLGRFDGDIRLLREQVCRLESKVDDLREDMTHKLVHRMPCP